MQIYTSMAEHRATSISLTDVVAIRSVRGSHGLPTAGIWSAPSSVDVLFRGCSEWVTVQEFAIDDYPQANDLRRNIMRLWQEANDGE